MSFLTQLVKLPGPASEVVSAPTACKACGSKHLYVQTDFNRGIGLWLVGIASVLTVIFAYMGYNWYATWSPMLAFLIMDRAFAATSPPVAICYLCEHLHRGLNHVEAQKIAPFDLDLHDRLHYAQRAAEEATDLPQ